jgi:hypothetical protein
MNIGVPQQIEIQPVGPGGHEFLQPRWRRSVELLQLRGLHEEPLTQIGINGCLTFGLGQAAQRHEVVAFDACEVVFGLRVRSAKDDVGVGGTVNVGDAPIVAHDGHGRTLAPPAGSLVPSAEGHRVGTHAGAQQGAQ